MAGVTIRAMENRDLDAVLQLFERVTEERLWIGTEPGFDPEERRRIYSDAIARGGCFVAEADGTVVGMLTAYPHEEYGWAIGMMLDVAYRGRGIGSMLLEQLEAWACERDVPHLSLLVFPHNERALALYRRNGYAEVKRFPADVRRSTGEIWDTILMRKTLR
jgi:ribosomal protein S18 acetylase RimI-like enzyme